jgi:hypothetical protein
MNYRFVIEDEVLDAFMHLNLRQREQIFTLFQRLADEAPMPAEVDHKDSVGRWILRRDFSAWTLWFWYDSPVKEVRIVDFQASRRRSR